MRKRIPIDYLCYIYGNNLLNRHELCFRHNPTQHSYGFDSAEGANWYETLVKDGVIEPSNIHSWEEAHNDYWHDYFLEGNNHVFYKLTDKGYKKLGLER